jgi:hypothetical protein
MAMCRGTQLQAENGKFRGGIASWDIIYFRGGCAEKGIAFLYIIFVRYRHITDII